MKWYEDLFVGESVTGKIKKIKWKIEHNAGMLHTYIITFPSNEENLLDIIPTRELLQKGYPKKNLHIIAVAGNYDEALLLACDIVKETYENTGKTDVKSYLKSDTPDFLSVPHNFYIRNLRNPSPEVPPEHITPVRAIKSLPSPGSASSDCCIHNPVQMPRCVDILFCNACFLNNCCKDCCRSCWCRNTLCRSD